MSEYFLFSNDSPSNLLKILDGRVGKDYYTGVTLTYIEQYVLCMQFSRTQIVDYILKHHSNGNLKSLYCGDVKNVVIHRMNHQNNYQKDDLYCYGEKGKYKYFINHLNQFKNGE